MAKMGNKMVAFCSAAIGAIYMAGFFVTNQPVSAQTTSAQTENSASVASAGQSGQQGASSASGSSSANTSNSASSSTTQKYKDGTFKGSGSNRIGTVEVQVTIKKDKITDVQITNCDTHYSEERIADLPQQVLERQSSDVDIVSGATKSTEDFANAVDQCLQQAMVNPS